MTDKKAISNVVIAIIVVCVVLVAVLGIYFASKGGIGIVKPKEVTLTGTVTTTGTGTSPEKITFKSLSDGQTYVANANGGTYSITLPNSDSYGVTITWKFLGITGGTADAGTLNLDSTEASITRNWAG